MENKPVIGDLINGPLSTLQRVPYSDINVNLYYYIHSSYGVESRYEYVGKITNKSQQRGTFTIEPLFTRAHNNERAHWIPLNSHHPQTMSPENYTFYAPAFGGRRKRTRRTNRKRTRRARH